MNATAIIRQPDPTAAWEAAIQAITLGDDADMHRLKRLSLRFLAGEWADLAIGHGWSCAELFGIFPASLTFAKRRGDCLGLVPAIALGSLTGKLIEIGPDAAMIERTSNGARLRHARHPGGHEWSIPWFDFHPEGGMQ